MAPDFPAQQTDIDSLEPQPIAQTRQYIFIFFCGYLLSTVLEIVATGKMFHPWFTLVGWASSAALFLGIFCLVSSMANRRAGWLALIATGLFVILAGPLELLN